MNGLRDFTFPPSLQPLRKFQITRYSLTCKQLQNIKQKKHGYHSRPLQAKLLVAVRFLVWCASTLCDSQRPKDYSNGAVERIVRTPQKNGPMHEKQGPTLSVVGREDQGSLAGHFTTSGGDQLSRHEFEQISGGEGLDEATGLEGLC
jgi:hypothetical protein